MSELLFVYGSLKRGGRHHAELRGAPCEGEASTAEGYRLVLQGDYPALAESDTGQVHGELFRVDAELLRELDVFEGCPTLYRRACITLSDGRQAIAYVVDRSRADEHREIASGRWP